MDLAGDVRWQGNADLVLRGAVNLDPNGGGGTRVLDVGTNTTTAQTGRLAINGVIQGAGNLVKTGNQDLVLMGLNTYTGTTTYTPNNIGSTTASLIVGTSKLPMKRRSSKPSTKDCLLNNRPKRCKPADWIGCTPEPSDAG